MKKTAYPFALLAGTLMLASCASDHLIQMKDGRTVVVKGKPQVDKATGMVVYTDENGQQQAVNQDQIREIGTLDN